MLTLETVIVLFTNLHQVIRGNLNYFTSVGFRTHMSSISYLTEWLN